MASTSVCSDDSYLTTYGLFTDTANEALPILISIYGHFSTSIVTSSVDAEETTERTFIKTAVPLTTGSEHAALDC